jgi:hypothetical protein
MRKAAGGLYILLMKLKISDSAVFLRKSHFRLVYIIIIIDEPAVISLLTPKLLHECIS